MRQIILDDIVIGGGAPFILVAGPCVIEDEEMTRGIAQFLKDITGQLKIPFIFKASYDKANRTSVDSFRGPGIKKGLQILADIKKDLGIHIISDVHRFEEIIPAAEVIDVLQIPAFLCRQTDFVIEVARNARIVNIKKGQFLAPWDVKNILIKASSTGNENIMITERGATFGYNNLVADYRSLPILREMGYPVIFDATHSVQLPGGMGTASGGQNDMVPYLSRAAVAVGVDGLFLEVHPNPECAKCDGPNSVRLDLLSDLLHTLMEIDGIIKGNRAVKKL
ncbi:MAG TPA: 3-deoxy-8-phosphooctulonate synthase [Syntrophales bacterium]|nr:3-deoxy-8-phosphooctulonate synthase [Syntrophales bacterium]